MKNNINEQADKKEVSPSEAKIIENEIKMKEIDEKFKYFENTKENFDKLFWHENIENIHLIENNQAIIEKKIQYLNLSKELYNIKKPELEIKLKLKKQTKNLFNEELAINNNNENSNSYFHIDPAAFNYGNNNKNPLYKTDGLINIYK